jgi:hypothetical protein
LSESWVGGYESASIRILFGAFRDIRSVGPAFLRRAHTLDLVEHGGA